MGIFRASPWHCFWKQSVGSSIWYYICRLFDCNQSQVLQRSIYRTQKKAVNLPEEVAPHKANSLEVNINSEVLDMQLLHHSPLLNCVSRHPSTHLSGRLFRDWSNFSLNIDQTLASLVSLTFCNYVSFTKDLVNFWIAHWTWFMKENRGFWYPFWKLFVTVHTSVNHFISGKLFQNFHVIL